jgi:hypothetical protein
MGTHIIFHSIMDSYLRSSLSHKIELCTTLVLRRSLTNFVFSKARDLLKLRHKNLTMVSQRDTFTSMEIFQLIGTATKIGKKIKECLRLTS